MRVLIFVALCAFVFAIGSARAARTGQPDAGGDNCGKLASLKIPNATITTAKTYAAGTFVGAPDPFTGADLSDSYKKLPAFCRVVAVATPTSDSKITIEVWMPLAGWNGRLQGQGNGGFAGLIATDPLGAAMAKGYAAAATDAGHTGSPAGMPTWALGHPEKVIDFGHRGIHEMTRVARLVVELFTALRPSTPTLRAVRTVGARR
jgi:feruloyl esterase